MKAQLVGLCGDLQRADCRLRPHRQRPHTLQLFTKVRCILLFLSRLEQSSTRDTLRSRREVFLLYFVQYIRNV
ncbi:Protein of unknown function [Gryllus bimaculatus]|nr:Protein of unknown function [Gryllus bimaculatus]